jgi:hypothetical protein
MNDRPASSEVQMLDYAPPGTSAASVPHVLFGRIAITLVPIAVMVGIACYGYADANGTNTGLERGAAVVLATGVVGVIVGLIGLLQRGRRKVLAAVAIPIHVAVALGFVFLIGLLA